MLSIQIHFIKTVFVEIGNAECVQSKPYRVLTPVYTGDYKIRAEDGLEMLKNYTRTAILATSNYS